MGGRHRLRRSSRYSFLYIISDGGISPVGPSCDAVLQEDGVFYPLQEDGSYICQEDPDVLLLEASDLLLESGLNLGLQ